MRVDHRIARGIALLGAVLAGSAGASEPAPAGALVAVRQLEPQSLERTLPPKTGILRAAMTQQLGFQVSGRVERIVGEGARVREGDEVAALDSDLEQAELRRAALLFGEAKRQLERARGLKASRAASAESLEAATTAVELRRAERDSAVERLARRRLRARFDGVVADVALEPGEIAAPGAAVARLINTDIMKLEVGVPGHQIGSVRPGAVARVRVPALGAAPFEGQVHIVPPSAAGEGALFRVEILIPNGERRLRPGMSARAEIVTERIADALLAPLDAVVERGAHRVVFFVDGGRARAVEVADGALVGESVLVEAGALRALVVRGQRDLRDGDPVRVDDAVLARAPAGAGPTP